MKDGVISVRFQLVYESFQLDVDLTLPNAGVSVVFGESGSGKTTLLRCMAGLEKPAHGFFSFNDNVWQDSKKNHFLPTHQRNIGYVFQEANLFTHLTVLENLQFGLKRIAKNQNNDNLFHVVELFGIGHLLDRMPERLSGGERQRVAIARALVLNPDILLMDEPLVSLDQKRKREVMPYLMTMQREFKTPIVYVTHSQREVMQLADYLVILNNGKVEAAGELKEMYGRLDLPSAKDNEAASVWDGIVKYHDSEFQLSCVEFNDIILNLPMLDVPVGKQVRILLNARDVSLALTAPTHSSILNVLPATITALADDQSGHTRISLSCGDQCLLADITRKSAQVLGLKIGTQVFAQIKGTSLLQ